MNIRDQHNNTIANGPNVISDQYPISVQYQKIYEFVTEICKDMPKLTNTATYYLIGCRYRIDLAKQHDKGSHIKVTTDYSALYGLNKSSIYAYSLYSKNLDIIKNKSYNCFKYLIREQIKYNYRNIKKLSSLKPAELDELSAFIDKNPNAGSYTQILNQLKTIIQNNNGKKSTPQKKSEQNTIVLKQENLPIKNMPAYDPDAELSSLIYTIPSWISSTKRARKNTQINQTSKKIRIELLNQLSELQDAITLMKIFLNEEEK